MLMKNVCDEITLWTAGFLK